MYTATTSEQVQHHYDRENFPIKVEGLGLICMPYHAATVYAIRKGSETPSHISWSEVMEKVKWHFKWERMPRCINPDCDNHVFPQNEVDVGIGVLQDNANDICEDCAETGYTPPKAKLPF